MLGDSLVVEAIIETGRLADAASPLDVPWQTISRWDLASVLMGNSGHVRMKPDDHPELPVKVLLAKLRALTRRSIIDCCYCGCRADIELPIAVDPRSWIDMPKWCLLVSPETIRAHVTRVTRR